MPRRRSSDRLRKPRGRYHHGELRQALVTTALRVVSEEGVDALSLRELARRLGVSHAAPAHHFPDKTALLVELAGEGFLRLSRELEAAAGGAPPPGGRLLPAVRAYLRFVLDHPAYFRIMFGRHVGELPRPSEPVIRAAEGGYRVLERAVEEVVGADDPARVTHLALVLWSLLHGMATLFLDGSLGKQARDLADRAAFEAWAERAVESVRDGLARLSGHGAAPARAPPSRGS